MHFSKTTEYAIRVLSYLDRYPNKAHSASFLHKELGLPYKYLTKLMTQLEKQDLVNVLKGRNGGFNLAKDSEQIFLCDILEAIGEPLEFDRCILGFEMCDASNPCALHSQWIEPKINIENMLQTTSLASLANDIKTKI
ncbi:Rrf2 family transcriptional regulator [Sulfurimonas sediminis]|uniref:Rrf2 family transcriptional regulator n=1 Tax=Sulfurimonas sediminis TaxID=2590020 RepID=A0A7M1AZ21_9BACT|nr:Rrf2 family transcriptional regulator [Sulfurimonas sediminis]QOP42615.1 Rrf2 family transcriptional regulator [Sulfurimonas sediminis]